LDKAGEESNNSVYRAFLLRRRGRLCVYVCVRIGLCPDMLRLGGKDASVFVSGFLQQVLQPLVCSRRPSAMQWYMAVRHPCPKMRWVASIAPTRSAARRRGR
jgi:hypothetical protein